MTEGNTLRRRISALFFAFFFFCPVSAVFAAPETELWTEYRVISGDTLDSIARSHSILEKNLRFANALPKEAALRTDSILLIPRTDGDACAALTEVLARKHGGSRPEVREAVAPSPRKDRRKPDATTVRLMTWPVKGTVSSPYGVRRGGRSRPISPAGGRIRRSGASRGRASPPGRRPAPGKARPESRRYGRRSQSR